MKKLKFLEGLRGLAALGVVVYHFLNNYYGAVVQAKEKLVHTSSKIELFLAKSPLTVLYNGKFFVCIFFVLSGFVLSYKYFKARDNNIITELAFKRYFRLVVPVVFSVMLVYIFARLWPDNQHASIKNPTLLGALYEGFFGSFFRNVFNYNRVLWTMTFEFFGSFLVFGFCLIFGNSRNRIFSYFLAVVIFWNTNYLAFILGTLLSDLYVSHNNFIKNKTIKILLLLIGLFLGSYPAYSGEELNSTIYKYITVSSIEDLNVFYYIIGAALLVMVLINSKTLIKIFSTSILQFLGKISFSLYLTHHMLMIYFSFSLFNIFYLNLKYSYFVSFIITFLISLVIIFIVAYFTYKYVDLYGIKFANYLYNKFFSFNNDKNIINFKIKTNKIKNSR